jgi:LysR family transcriptional regulator, glycine cleavage system transcriptional activator
VTRRLAHLNALRAFEATARLGSFVAAAAELAVSAAAVGQHVRALEDYFGVALFERRGRTLVLSQAARGVLPDVQEAFDRLASASNRLRDARLVTLLTVSMPPSLAAKWLIPRLERFRIAQPEIDLRLDTTDRLVDMSREGVSLAIRYGTGRYPGLSATLLMAEDVFPVCSPALLARARKLRRAEDLQHFKLIHDTTLERHAGFPTWATWLKAAGTRGVDARRGLRIGSSIMALQAAIEGQGVALARSVIVASDLAEGRLVRPFDTALPTGYSYYLLQPRDTALSQGGAAFAQWLREEAAEFAGAGGPRQRSSS